MTNQDPSRPHLFEPSKRVLSQSDLESLHQHPDFSDLVEFILSLNEASKTVAIKEVSAVAEEPIVSAILGLLGELDVLIQQFDPDSSSKSDSSTTNSSSVVNAGRFGNPLFRQWYDSMSAVVNNRVLKILEDYGTENMKVYSLEVSKYLKESFGDRQRIDYGTGHELNFMCFLYCLQRLNILKHPQPHLNCQVALLVFPRYISLMRSLQFKYWLEPAGSHGVWGLDDYHFLPFMFGSAQLIGHKYIRPKSIHDQDIVNEFSDNYLYFSCIKFVNSVKTASLAWHSPMLNDISGVKNWEKVNHGLIKMYRCEVLSKLPIMQHFLIGRLIGGDRFAEAVTVNTGVQLADSELLPIGKNNMHTFCGDTADTAMVNASPLICKPEGTGQDSSNEEVVVKYIRGPAGNLIPIYGRHVHGHAAIETYAMGQEPPKCCGMRIPSAVAAAAAAVGTRRIPFD